MVRLARSEQGQRRVRRLSVHCRKHLERGHIEDPAPESIKSTVEIIESLYDLRRRDALCFKREKSNRPYSRRRRRVLHLVNNRMAFDILICERRLCAGSRRKSEQSAPKRKNVHHSHKRTSKAASWKCSIVRTKESCALFIR